MLIELFGIGIGLIGFALLAAINWLVTSNTSKKISAEKLQEVWTAIGNIAAQGKRLESNQRVLKRRITGQVSKTETNDDITSPLSRDVDYDADYYG